MPSSGNDLLLLTSCTILSRKKKENKEKPLDDKLIQKRKQFSHEHLLNELKFKSKADYENSSLHFSMMSRTLAFYF